MIRMISYQSKLGIKVCIETKLHHFDEALSQYNIDSILGWDIFQNRKELTINSYSKRNTYLMDNCRRASPKAEKRSNLSLVSALKLDSKCAF